jgi:predicted ATPase
MDLSLAPLNVLIGANGVGKSSVLDVLDLLAAAAEGGLESALSDSGGISSLLTQDGKTDAMTFSLQMPILKQYPLSYELKISRQGVGYSISREQLTQAQGTQTPNLFKFIDAHGARINYHDPNEKKLRKPSWNHNAAETALSQVPKMYQIPERFRHTLASSSALYHTLDVSVRAPVRLPQRMRPATTPGSDGGDLLSCLYMMKETERGSVRGGRGFSPRRVSNVRPDRFATCGGGDVDLSVEGPRFRGSFPSASAFRGQLALPLAGDVVAKPRPAGGDIDR